MKISPLETHYLGGKNVVVYNVHKKKKGPSFCSKYRMYSLFCGKQNQPNNLETAEGFSRSLRYQVLFTP